MRGTMLVHAIREDASKYPNVCRMEVCLYDTKDRADNGPDAVFAEDLFADNAQERKRFIDFLDELEKDCPEFMRVKISEWLVSMFYKSPRVQLFSRKTFECVD